MRHISGLDPAATQFTNRVSHVASLNIDAVRVVGTELKYEAAAAHVEVRKPAHHEAMHAAHAILPVLINGLPSHAKDGNAKAPLVTGRDLKSCLLYTSPSPRDS